MSTMRHVVSFSGGLGSWATAVLIVEQYGTSDVDLVFNDTKMEDEDLYRFLDETTAHLGIELTVLEDGRDPWEVFKDERFLGNSRLDPCSKILKRNLFRRWLKENHSAETTINYIGIDWSEINRFERARARWHAGR